MKKILFPLITLLLFSASIDAQEKCGTPSPTPPHWIFNKGQRSSAATANYKLNVFIHIVRSSSGYGLGAEISPSIVSQLNSGFASAGIQFRLQDTDFIDNDFYYDGMNDEKAERLFAVNAHSDAIDIYVLGESTVWEYAGLAKSVLSKSFIVQGNYYNNTVILAHEMGHCLGLYHTHHGTVKEKGDAIQCPELADGSNSTTCGDYVSDTPADPNKWSGCSYIGPTFDISKHRYTPDPSNYMSYADGCRTRFSSGQIRKMKEFIETTSLLQQVVFRYEIAGPTVVCNQGMYTIPDLSDGVSVQWSTSNGNLQLVSGQGTRTAVFRRNGWGECMIQAQIASYNSAITHRTWEGKPSRPAGIKGMKNQLAPNSQYGFWIDDAWNADYIEWTVWGGQILGGQGSSHVSVETAAHGAFRIMARKKNSCGWSESYTGYGSINSGLAPFSLSPNPAEDVVTLQLTEAEGEHRALGSPQAMGTTSTYEIQLWSGLAMLRSFQTNQPTFQIPIAGLPAGFYFVRVIKDGQIYTEKLIKR